MPRLGGARRLVAVNGVTTSAWSDIASTNCPPTHTPWASQHLGPRWVRNQVTPPTRRLAAAILPSPTQPRAPSRRNAAKRQRTCGHAKGTASRTDTAIAPSVHAVRRDTPQPMNRDERCMRERWATR